jgi:hypothetical protein
VQALEAGLRAAVAQPTHNEKPETAVAEGASVAVQADVQHTEPKPTNGSETVVHATDSSQLLKPHGDNSGVSGQAAEIAEAQDANHLGEAPQLLEDQEKEKRLPEIKAHEQAVVQQGGQSTLTSESMGAAAALPNTTLSEKKAPTDFVPSMKEQDIQPPPPPSEPETATNKAEAEKLPNSAEPDAGPRVDGKLSEPPVDTLEQNAADLKPPEVLEPSSNNAVELKPQEEAAVRLSQTVEDAGTFSWANYPQPTIFLLFCEGCCQPKSFWETDWGAVESVMI